MKSAVATVTQRIAARSADTRAAYLARLARFSARPPGAERMGCANVAHAFAALPSSDKLRVVAERGPHLAVVTAYNDMLSAHQPYEAFPALIREEARARGDQDLGSARRPARHRGAGARFRRPGGAAPRVQGWRTAPATWSSSCVSRACTPTACPNCTS
jgi:hypothetical protein